MDSVRLANPDKIFPWVPCCRCTQAHERWDKIVGKPYCPSCEEQLVLGEAEPLVERTAHRPCAVCGRLGTLCYLTFPLHSGTPVELDLCGEHLRALLGRSLRPAAYHQLRRLLVDAGLDPANIFLLHDAFYDLQGHALQPALEL
jgi:hypothetical protein